MPISLPASILAGTATADYFAGRILHDTPAGWASEAAKSPGGLVYAAAYAIGGQLAFLASQIAYSYRSLRLATATDPEISLAAADFYGPGGLLRAVGQTDAQYAASIRGGLFKQGGSRGLILAAVQALFPAATVHCIEAWSGNDTGWIDQGIYCDIDTLANPSRNTPGPSGQAYFDITGAGSVTIATIAATIEKQKIFGTSIGIRLADQPGGGGGTVTPDGTGTWDGGATWDDGTTWG